MVEQDRRRRVRRLLALAGVLMAVAGAVVLIADPGGGDDGGSDVPEAGSRFREDDKGSEQSLLEALAPVLGREEAKVGMTLDRAVAQLFAVGFEGTTPPDALVKRMRERAWGIVLVSGANYQSPSQLRDALGRLEKSAAKGRQAPPLFAANPAVLGGLGPAPAPDIGLEGKPDDARAEAQDAARRLREVHVPLALAPSADLGVGGGPAEDRAFTDDPREAATFVEAAVQGWTAGKVLVAPGRFPGEGGASQDPLLGAATVGLSVEELSSRDLLPFRAAVGAGAPAIQMSAAVYAAWDGVTPATLLPDAVRFLRKATGFDGVIVSADLIAATGVGGGGVARAAVEALNAGCDLLLVAGGREEQEAAYRGVVNGVRRGQISRARLIEAARRVAKLKAAIPE